VTGDAPTTDRPEPPPAAAGTGGAAGTSEPTNPVDALRKGSKDTAEAIADTRERVSAAVDERRGGPAESVDDARGKLEDLRGAMDRDLAALRARIPDPEETAARARTIALATGGGLAALITLRAIGRRRKEQRRRHEDLREQAVALARELAKLDSAELVLEDSPEEAGHGRRWVLLGIAAVGAAAVVWTRMQPPADELDVWGPPA
jgi:hypothetical protein